MSINYIDKLNETFVELLTDLVEVFPDDGDFHIYMMAAQTAVAVNDRFIYQVFKKKIVQYEVQIMEQDENFMINFDMESQLETSTDTVKEHMVYVIRKLRGLWCVISENDRDIIWRYFKTMVRIYHKIEVDD